ncbi:hypothetical protein SteCoe_34128 [Stentor coeruleus]|uniref:RCC1-like domain-containing protein n=1 Tax=Stentor coeruleus TaxID=5963 RepID=A0A1R2AV56_9CILI|nr:hypothetical protein SteCoe_34128 [Stentor coeruleus]
MESYTEIFAWGGDSFGQLGLGNKHSGKTYSSPRFCSFNILIKDISCGEEHSAFISQSGHVYCMGSNNDGRLGLGNKNIRQSSSPCLVEGLTSYKCIKLSCGWGHTVVITDDGSVFSWGVGEFGALGNGKGDNAWSPIRCLLPKSMKGLEVSSGSRHTGLIVEDNKIKLLLMTGSGEAGQLGTGKREKEYSYVIINMIEEVQSVSCGVFHTLILGISGKIYATGGNSFGQLGLGNKKSSTRPERVSLDSYIIKISCCSHSAAISDKGQLFVWGTGVFGEYLLPTKFSIPVCKDVVIGGSYGLAVDISGNVHAWGANSNGELGVGDYESKANPTLISFMKGKTIKKLSCGGNYVLGIGLDVVVEKKNELSIIEEVNGKNMKKDENFRVRNDDKSRGVYEKTRGCSMDIEKIRHFDPEIRYKENDKIKICDVDNRNRARHSEIDYRGLEKKAGDQDKRDQERCRGKENDRENKEKRNLKVENLKNELAKTVEKNNQYKGECQRLEREIEEVYNTMEFTIKDLQLSNNHLKQALEESQKHNYGLGLEVKSCKDEVQKYKKMTEELKLASKIEASQRIDEINQNMQEKYIEEIREMKILQEQDTVKRKQLEKNIEISSRHIASLDEAMSKSQTECMMLRNQLENSLKTYEMNKESLQLEIENYYKENNDLKLMMEKSCEDMKELEYNNDKLICEKKEIMINMERVFEENKGLEKENQELKMHISSLCDQNKDIKSQLAEYYKETTEINARIESASKQSLDYMSQASSLAEELKTLMNKNEILVQEKSQLQSQLEKSIKNSTTLENSLENLQKQIKILTQEKNELTLFMKNQLENLETQIENQSDLQSQLSLSNQTLDDYKLQLTNLSQQIPEYISTINNQNSDIIEWETKYQLLLDENNILKETVTDLENKNKNMLENLEKDLAQKAKEYKQRTIQMLNTPNKSSSPFMKHLTNVGHCRGRSEDQSFDAKNGDAEDGLKYEKITQNSVVGQNLKDSITPTSEDIRSKIATLMKNRMKIEEKIQNLGQE